MDWETIDWVLLERLREAFLRGTSGAADYWSDERALASYDLTFAARIGWKWDFVLDELRRRGWRPPAGRLLDWGCGTGIAARRFLHHFGAAAVREVALWDRSRAAMDFAAAQVRAEHPGVAVIGGNGAGEAGLASTTANGNNDRQRPATIYRGPTTANCDNGRQQHPPAVLGASTATATATATTTADGDGTGRASPAPTTAGGDGTLLVSHVISELSDRQLDELVERAAGAAAVLWVEPGTHEASRRLITRVRERLRDRFTIKGPCTHQAECGLLAPGRERHWCHQFAPSPAEIHQEARWSRFARLTGVDLRSLPLAFLVLDRRPDVAALPPGAVRIVGRPRVYKAHALLFGCDASGVADRRLLKRRFPEEFRRLRRDEVETLQVWRLAGDEIVERSAVVG